MPLEYKLIRPIVAFCKTDERVLTIPANECISLSSARGQVGVCHAYWRGRPVFVFREDIEQNAVVVAEKGVTG